MHQEDAQKKSDIHDALGKVSFTTIMSGAHSLSPDAEKVDQIDTEFGGIDLIADSRVPKNTVLAIDKTMARQLYPKSRDRIEHENGQLRLKVHAQRKQLRQLNKAVIFKNHIIGTQEVENQRLRAMVEQRGEVIDNACNENARLREELEGWRNGTIGIGGSGE